MQTFGEVADVVAIARSGQLLGERGGVAGHVERLGCDHAGSLVVSMILAGHVIGQPSENDFGSREAHQAHRLAESRAMVPCFQRAQNILPRSIWSAQEPNVCDLQYTKCPARLNLTLSAECGRLLLPGCIPAAVSSRAKDHGDAFVLIED